jgi:hypothetical protein
MPVNQPDIYQPWCDYRPQTNKTATLSPRMPAVEEEAANRVAGLLFGVAEMDGVANP